MKRASPGSGPTGALGRAGAVVATLAQVGARSAAHALTRPLRSPESEVAARRELSGAVAARVFETLTSLRGAGLKIAQALAWETDFLPPELLRQIERSWHSVPPLPGYLISTAIRDSLGARPRELFAHFEDTPFAAASLGQVHAARTHDGRDVAVKVLYPSMAHSLDSDVSTLAALLRFFPNAALLLELLDEIAARMREECDYRKEAESLGWFGAKWREADIALPRVVDELSTDKVLTMTRLPGAHLKAWIESNPSSAQRERCCDALIWSFWDGLFTLGRIHADPNPGNVLFADEGPVGLIDFGCIKRLPRSFVALIRNLLRAYTAGDHRQAFSVAWKGGLFEGLDRGRAEQVESSVVRPFAEWLVAPLREERFDFGRHPGFAVEGRRLFIEVVRANPRAGVYRDFVLVNRTLYGLYRIFEALGAGVRVGDARLLPAP